MKVRATKKLFSEDIENILIRGTNWIGDAIMTLPAVAAVRATFPQARITVLCKPWVATLYEISSDVHDIFEFESPGRHDGIGGKFRLARELQQKDFDCAILLQNAIEAAIITFFARIPLRIGYNSDGRGLLLTHSVTRTPAIRKIHQVYYYLEMLKSLGFRSAGETVNLDIGDDMRLRAHTFLTERGVGNEDILVGMAPGATYGPAKMWYPERFAAVADRLGKKFNARVILFGSKSDRERTDRVQQHTSLPCVNVAGETTLREAIGLINCCDLFISNDSGLMHLAGALGIPLVAIFGSTNPVTTSPVGEKSVVVHKDVPCSPCMKKVCPTDFMCMNLITSDDVYQSAKTLLEENMGNKAGHVCRVPV